MKIKTHDLFLGAYIITNGGALDSAVLEQSRKGRQTIQFYFTGENVPACHEQYQSGQATANVSAKETMYNYWYYKKYNENLKLIRKKRSFARIRDNKTFMKHAGDGTKSPPEK